MILYEKKYKGGAKMQETMMSKTFFEYEELSFETLTLMLTSFRDYTFNENKRLVFNALVNKYFKDKSKFNLYQYMNKQDNLQYFSREDKPVAFMNILLRELSDTVKFPKEYIEDFFAFLFRSIDIINSSLKENGAEMQWDFSNTKVLLGYLMELENTDIATPSIRQKINALVKDLKATVDSQRKNKDNQLILIENSKISESINQITELKLQKSKLTKGNFCSALSSFNLYSLEDQKYLIAYGLKKNWKDSIYSEIKNIDLFRFIIENKQYELNPWKILSKEFNGYFSKVSFNIWADYFNVTTIEDLFKSIRELYLSFDGATDKGVNAYIYSLMDSYVSCIRPRLDSKDMGSTDTMNIVPLFVNLIKDRMTEILSLFSRFEGGSLRDFALTNIQFQYYKMKESPYIDKFTNRMVENVVDVSVDMPAITTYLEVHKRCNGLFYQFEGFYSKNKKIIYFSQDKEFEEINEKINVFLNFIDTLTFNGDDIRELSTKCFNYGYFETRKQMTKDELFAIIRRYFCTNEDNISDELIKSIWYDKENLKAFKSIIGYTPSSGWFLQLSDFTEFFYNRMKDSLNFGNEDDFNKFFRLGLSFYSAEAPIYKSFMKKVKVECPYGYSVVNAFIGENPHNLNTNDVYKLLSSMFYTEENG